MSSKPSNNNKQPILRATHVFRGIHFSPARPQRDAERKLFSMGQKREKTMEVTFTEADKESLVRIVKELQKMGAKGAKVRTRRPKVPSVIEMTFPRPVLLTKKLFSTAAEERPPWLGVLAPARLAFSITSTRSDDLATARHGVPERIDTPRYRRWWAVREAELPPWLRRRPSKLRHGPSGFFLHKEVPSRPLRVG